MTGFSLQSGIDDLINMENTMGILKLTTATLVAATLATASFAGTIEPVTEDVMVDEAAPGSSAGSSGGGILLPLLGLALVIALIASDDDSAPAPVVQ